MGRKKRSREEGEALVARYRESGLTQRGFAQAEGVSLSAVMYWVSKVSREKAVENCVSGARFVEVTPRSFGKSAIDNDGCGLVIEIGHGIRLQFDHLPRAQYLAEVMNALVATSRC